MSLVPYRKSHEKTAMDFLSFMPCHQVLSDLQKTLRQYENDPNWQLYLHQEGEDYVGVIGIELRKHTFCVHHICVDPSARNEGIGNIMVEQVQELHEPLALCTTSETKDFLAKCWDKQQII